LLNCPEVKGRHIRDRLDMIVAGEIGVGLALETAIVSGNGGNPGEGDRLSEVGVEIRLVVLR
jgi:hypothetical protein